MKRFALLLTTVAVLVFAARPFGQPSATDIAFDSAANFLKLPAEIHLGEVAGVATDSKGQIFVYTRTGNPTVGLGNSRLFTHGGSRLFQFDPRGNYLREIGQGVYAFLVAHAVRVDPQDNIWTVDEGSNQIVKFGPDGRVLMILGRKPESVTIRLPPAAGATPGGGGGPAIPGQGGRAGAAPPGSGGAGDQFTRPSDVAWDADGNIFVADGHGANARIAKFDKNGRFIKSWGSRGSEPGQFDTPHSIAIDPQGNVYVADQANKRIQVADRERRRPDRSLYLARIASVPLQLPLRRSLRDGRRGDLQARARRPGCRQVREGREADERARPRQLDRLSRRERAVRRRALELARTETDAASALSAHDLVRHSRTTTSYALSVGRVNLQYLPSCVMLSG
jgi:hypothetical protein